MGLFKPDLYRAFIIGFLLGAAGLVGTMDPPARAAIAASLSL